jgi:D-threo-aldose 1-dehydrogenase
VTDQPGPDPRELRPLGSSGVQVTRLGLGGAPLGNLFHEVSDADAEAAVGAAYAAGIRFYDTAPLYGHGLSERRLGRALAAHPRDELVVTTKVGRRLVALSGLGARADTIYHALPPVDPVFDFSAEGVRRSLEESLTRLDLDRVDVLHVHDPDDHAEEALRGAFPELRRMRDEGIVGAIGAGMNQSALLTRFVQEAELDCVLLAGRYSLLDQSALDDLLPLCAATGVSVIAAGVFNSGLLADPGRADATFDYGPAPTGMVQQARALGALCRRHGASLTAAALQFPLGHPAVATVLMGARSAREVEQNVAAFSAPVPAALWDDLRRAGLVPVPGE